MTLQFLTRLSDAFSNLTGPSISPETIAREEIKQLISSVAPTAWTIAPNEVRIVDGGNTAEIGYSKNKRHWNVSVKLIRESQCTNLVLNGREAKEIIVLLDRTIAQHAANLKDQMHAIIEELKQNADFVDSLDWREIARDSRLRHGREFVSAHANLQLRLSFESSYVPGYQMEMNISRGMDPSEARWADSMGRAEALSDFIREQEFRKLNPFSNDLFAPPDPELRIAFAGFSAYCGRHNGVVLEVNTFGLTKSCGSAFQISIECTADVANLYNQVVALVDKQPQA